MAIKRIGAFPSLSCACLHDVWRRVSQKRFCFRFDFGDPASEHGQFGLVQIFCVGLLRGLGDPCSHSLNAGHVRHGKHREDAVIQEETIINFHCKSLAGALRPLIICQTY